MCTCVSIAVHLVLCLGVVIIIIILIINLAVTGFLSHHIVAEINNKPKRMSRDISG